jgi:hypothetical protein
MAPVAVRQRREAQEYSIEAGVAEKATFDAFGGTGHA